MGQIFKFEQPPANTGVESNNKVKLTLEQADQLLKEIGEYRRALALDLKNSRKHLEELGGRKLLERLKEQLQGINEWQEDANEEDIKLVDSLMT